MSETKITRPFADGAYDFDLTYDLAHAFERDNRTSLFATHKGILDSDWRVKHIAEIIRLALIGGGTDDVKAYDLVETYVKPRPLGDSAALASDILNVAFFGTSEA
ncbi:gene transfer agent family protein [Brucella pituitosa]|nr:gene transfer agent family protein [Brucella pituitosa]